jgi:hypothetical protein
MKQIAFAVAAFVTCSIAYAQSTDEPPPMKMGLWEITNVLTAKGKPQALTLKVHACLTPDTWRKVLAEEKKDECQKRNFKQNASGMSWNVDCPLKKGSKATGRSKIIFVSQKEIHQVAHMDIPDDGRQTLAIDTVTDGVYLSEDCKGIAPGSAKVIPRH